MRASEQWRMQLVETLGHEGVIHTPAVRDAFLSVPREQFIERWYERDGRTWNLCEKSGAMEEWLNRIYQDDALITAINQHQLPVSSSSQPSIMASMLEALDLHQGMRVLEIGTGTGYNAALMGKLVGESGQVISIDIDVHLIEQAKQHLHDGGIRNVRVLAGDGLFGVEDDAPYDRIIATGGSSFLPSAWYEQLAPGGKLLLPLQGSLQESGLLLIEKEDEKRGNGIFLSTPVFFMSLYTVLQELRPYASMPPELMRQSVTGAILVRADDPLLPALQESTFKWFLQWFWSLEGEVRMSPMRSPDGKEELLRMYDACSHTLLFLKKRADGSWSGHLRGTDPLWAKIQQGHQRYQELGQPGREAFRVSVSKQEARLSVGETLLRNLFSDSEQRAQTEIAQ